MAPTLHLNGTGRADLLNQQRNAMQALRLALTAMQNAAPHGRDYYPQGPDALAKAQAEHAMRLALVEKVLGDLEILAASIHDGGYVRP